MDPTVSVAVVAGYAAEIDTLKGNPADAYRFGVGARAGVTFSSPRLYAGIAYTHHFGTPARAGGAFEQRYRDTLLGGELGYELGLSKALSLRPYVGLGATFATRSTDVRGAVIDESATRFHVAPGLLLAYRVGHAFIGGDLRAVVTPSLPAALWAGGAMITLGFVL